MPFCCSKCGAVIERSFDNDARYTPPQACCTEGCRSRNFLPQYKAAHCLNWQQIRLQVRLPGLWQCGLACAVVLHAACAARAHAVTVPDQLLFLGCSAGTM